MLFFAQLGEELPLYVARRCLFLIPSHSLYKFFCALQQSRTVGAYQGVAAFRGGVGYSSGECEAVPLVAFGYVGGDYGPGGNDEAVYRSDFRFIRVDDYTRFGEYIPGRRQACR